MVRSATKTRPAFLSRLWSTPKDDVRPKACKHEVTLAVPAQISRMKGSFDGHEVFGLSWAATGCATGMVLHVLPENWHELSGPSSSGGDTGECLCSEGALALLHE